MLCPPAGRAGPSHDLGWMPPNVAGHPERGVFQPTRDLLFFRGNNLQQIPRCLKGELLGMTTRWGMVREERPGRRVNGHSMLCPYKIQTKATMSIERSE